MADVLDPVIRELRAIIERARTNARLEERRRIVAALRKAAFWPSTDACIALTEAARAIESGEDSIPPRA